MIPAIIIARGGSRRLPRKNLKPLCGRPLVEWSAIQALNSHRVSEVWLSTDDEEIAGIASRAGAKVFREEPIPEGQMRPHGGHAMYRLASRLGADAFLTILPTAVVWKPDDFDRAIDLFFRLDAGEVTPKFNARECYAGRVLGDNLMRRAIFGKHFEYAINGEQWAVCSMDFYRNYIACMPYTDAGVDELVGRGAAPESCTQFHFYPIHWWQQFDIDDQESFELAELLMERFILKPLGRDCYERYGMDKRQPTVAP